MERFSSIIEILKQLREEQMEKFRLFKIYNIRNMINDKVQIALTVFAFSIAIGLLTMVFMLLNYCDNFLDSNLVNLNHGDIAIKCSNKPLNNEQKEFLNTLVREKKAEYNIEYNSLTVINYNHKNIRTGIRIVDFNLFPFYSEYQKNIKKISNTQDKVVISDTLAKKANIKKEGILNFSNEHMPISKVIVDNIIPNNEINIDWASAYGYILIDQSAFLKALSNKGTVVNSMDDYQMSKVIYIKSNNENYEALVKDINKEFYTDDFNIITRQNVKTYFGDSLKSISSVLFILSLLGFIVVGPGFLLLMYLRGIRQQDDYAVLKVFGLKSKDIILSVIKESIIISILANILGIILGYYMFKYMSLTILGLKLDTDVSFTIILISLKIALVSTIIIVSHSIISIIIVLKQDPIRVLRKQELDINLKHEISKVIFLLCILYIFMFSILTKSITSAFLIGGILFFIGMIYIVISMLIRIIPKRIYKGKIFKISIRNVINNNTRTSIVITAIIVCVLFSFIIIQMKFGLYNALNSYYVNSSDFNVMASVASNNSKDIEEVFRVNGFDKYYIMKTTQLETENNEKVSVEVASFTQADNNYLSSLNDGVIISDKFAEKSGIRIGEFINVKQNNNNFKFKVNEIKKTYQFDVLKYDIIVLDKHAQGLQFFNTNFFFNLTNSSKNELEVLKDLEKYNLYFSDSEAIINYFLEYNNKYIKLFNILALLLIFSTFFIVSLMTLITVTQRIKEFVLLQVHGATKNHIIRIILYENIIISFIASIISIIFSSFIIKFIIDSIGFFKYDVDYQLSLGLILGTTILVTAISIITIFKVKFDDFNDLLRQE